MQNKHYIIINTQSYYQFFLKSSFIEIDLLNGLNVVLKERHEIESNYNHLNIKFSNIQKEEADRHERVK